MSVYRNLRRVSGMVVNFAAFQLLAAGFAFWLAGVGGEHLSIFWAMAVTMTISSLLAPVFLALAFAVFHLCRRVGKRA